MSYAFWTAAEERALRRLYATEPNAELAERLGRHAKAIGLKARKMGLRKAGNAGCFRRGLVPWNKGKHHKPPGSEKGWFRAGELRGSAAQRVQPIGTEKLDKDGNLIRKVSNSRSRFARWQPVHRLVWESMHGPVPRGYIVVFKPGRHTAVAKDITLDRLECITRTENMRRNSRHTRYGPELNRLMQLRGALNRKIHNREATP